MRSQKRRQLRGHDKGSEEFWPLPRLRGDPAQRGHELIEVVWATIGERGLEMGPDELVRVQVGGIAGEGLDVQPWTPGKQGAHVGTLVNAAAVPEDDDVPAELAEHGAQEHRDLHMGDVAPGIEMDVEPA